MASRQDPRSQMLPPFIIEQIREREEREKAQRPRPAVHLPLPSAPLRPATPANGADIEEDGERGVIVIDLMG